MSIEQRILDEEYERTLNRLMQRSSLGGFTLDEVIQELRHLQIYEGQDWAGRGEIKNAEIAGQIYAYQIFIKRWKDAHLATAANG
ncbi:MAG: hypothetical protein CVV52_01265 [Spirochaetae bacterium HGW-Spirochaetae-8]|nr:MAG: hypothetical protein CVV52_01265 [Spirochaetae bacterium HGW-Spirochaetae-8]